MIRFVSALALALLVSVASWSVAVDEKPLDDPIKEAQARALMKEIRCLVCQNQSIEDSNAELAQDLRAIVRERIGLGDSPENVKAYLVDRYGDWVLLKPPVKLSTYFLWVSPFLVIVVVFVLVVGRKKQATSPVPLTAEEEAQLKAMLEQEQ